MTFAEFEKEIANGKFHPVYLFSGKEDYLAERGVKALVEALVPGEARDLNYSVFYGDNADGLPEALSSPPVFHDHRLIVVRQAHKLSERNLKTVDIHTAEPPEDACLVLLAMGADKRKAAFKQLQKKAVEVGCEKLRPAELSRWMNGYTKGWGKKLDPEAAERLAAINWPNLQELAAELDRLALLAGDAETIRLADIEELGGGSFALERWNLTDAVGDGDIAAAVAAVENLQRWDIKPAQVLHDLFRLFSNLWQIKWFAVRKRHPEGRKALGLRDFLYRRYSVSVRRVSPRTLTDCIAAILEADLNIKHGNREAGLEVNLLVTKLAGLMQGRKWR